MGGCGGATPPHPDRLPITSPQQKPCQVQPQPAAELKWGGCGGGLTKSQIMVHGKLPKWDQNQGLRGGIDRSR